MGGNQNFDDAAAYEAAASSYDEAEQRLIKARESYSKARTFIGRALNSFRLNMASRDVYDTGEHLEFHEELRQRLAKDSE